MGLKKQAGQVGLVLDHLMRRQGFSLRQTLPADLTSSSPPSTSSINLATRPLSSKFTDGLGLSMPHRRRTSASPRLCVVAGC
jgi:hypothetical protein